MPRQSNGFNMLDVKKKKPERHLTSDSSEPAHIPQRNCIALRAYTSRNYSDHDRSY